MARAMRRALHATRMPAGSGLFIAVGGDGTSYEVVNGLFPEASAGEPPTLGFLPLGTGNSFCAISAIAAWSTRSNR